MFILINRHDQWSSNFKKISSSSIVLDSNFFNIVRVLTSNRYFIAQNKFELVFIFIRLLLLKRKNIYIYHGSVDRESQTKTRRLLKVIMLLLLRLLDKVKLLSIWAISDYVKRSIQNKSYVSFNEIFVLNHPFASRNISSDTSSQNSKKILLVQNHISRETVDQDMIRKLLNSGYRLDIVGQYDQSDVELAPQAVFLGYLSEDELLKRISQYDYFYNCLQDPENWYNLSVFNCLGLGLNMLYKPRGDLNNIVENPKVFSDSGLCVASIRDSGISNYIAENLDLIAIQRSLSDWIIRHSRIFILSPGKTGSSSISSTTNNFLQLHTNGILTPTNVRIHNFGIFTPIVDRLARRLRLLVRNRSSSIWLVTTRGEEARSKSAFFQDLHFYMVANQRQKSRIIDHNTNFLRELYERYYDKNFLGKWIKLELSPITKQEYRENQRIYLSSIREPQVFYCKSGATVVFINIGQDSTINKIPIFLPECEDSKINVSKDKWYSCLLNKI